MAGCEFPKNQRAASLSSIRSIPQKKNYSSMKWILLIEAAFYPISDETIISVYQKKHNEHRQEMDEQQI